MTQAHNPLDSAAFEYIERGVSIIPIHPTSKRPLIKWKDFQDRIATEEDIANWQRYAVQSSIPLEDIKLAVVTGRISGFVIVDCDSPEAVAHCKAVGIWSPVRVRTKHGLHLYFRHSMDRDYRPRVGSNSKGIDWPKVAGLDFRGDGSYALVPPSSGYSWDVDPGFEIDDPYDWPEWGGWPMDHEPGTQPMLPDQSCERRFSDLDLTNIPVKSTVSVWEATTAFVEQHFPFDLLIPSDRGNGRNQRVLSYASEQILYGFWGDMLDERVCLFMDNFFVERLADEEWKATCRSVEAMERANHPERFTNDGTYIPPFDADALRSKNDLASEPEPEPEPEEDGLVVGSQILERLSDIKEEYYIRPLLPKACVMQVVGYSGQGKSTFVQLITHAMATTRKTFGPFDIDEHPSKILYLNYEEGARTIKERVEDNIQLLGDFDADNPDRLVIYAPSISRDQGMYLNTADGLKRLGHLLRRHRPDVLVIDTVRSAFPGIDENSSAAWSTINEICLKLRNVGVNVIMLHHRNKATKDGMGSYAGSTNSITVVEVQVYISQLYEDEETAAARGGKHDVESKIHDQFYARLPGGRVDWAIDYIMEVEYGKTRDWTEDHDKVQHIGLATHLHDDRQTLVALPSSKQKAIRLYHDNFPLHQICQVVRRRKSVVKRWLEPHQIKI